MYYFQTTYIPSILVFVVWILPHQRLITFVDLKQNKYPWSWMISNIFIFMNNFEDYNTKDYYTLTMNISFTFVFTLKPKIVCWLRCNGLHGLDFLCEIFLSLLKMFFRLYISINKNQSKTNVTHKRHTLWL